MKKIIVSAIILATVLISCNSNKSEEAGNTTNEVIPENNIAQSPDEPEDTAHLELSLDTTSKIVKTKTDFSIDAIVNNYLKLKNALTKDDPKGAARAGKALYTAFNNANYHALDPKSKKEYLEIADDAKEHSEHISENSGEIEHQREHFALLSKDVDDLIKLFGTKRKLYLNFCPMYDEGNGAFWLSEIKEIKNPYYGEKMLTCGSIKKEFKK